VTDVRLETKCNPISSTRGAATGGCAFQLDPMDWNYAATHNRSGDPVTVTVRAAPSDVSCVSGSNARPFLTPGNLNKWGRLPLPIARWAEDDLRTRRRGLR
jgi:hypothetical protein